MYRKLTRKLNEWSEEKKPKPLLITGARQVGKTYIIEEFCKNHFEDFFSINLERQEGYSSVFDDSLEPSDILRKLSMLSGRSISPDTVIFIDEIQQSERAVTALKYFYEDDSCYHVIGAGSLLGVKLNRFNSSFPVGKVDIINMFPMDFEEFLIACGEETMKDGIMEAYTAKKSLPLGIHDKAVSLYTDYLFTGGMPESVADYISKNKNISSLDSRILDNLKTAYLADMTKYTYSAAEAVKITEIYNSIPRQLARENPKFKYSDIRQYANKRDFMTALDWLVSSGMVYKVRNLEAPLCPLGAYEAETGEKIYLSDVGLLMHISGMNYKDMLVSAHNIYKGAVTENYVVEQLSAKGLHLYYYKPSESMEIDLVLEINDEIIPVEIKSGRHKRSTSLKNYINKYAPQYAVRISELNFGFSDGIFSVPLYAVWCI